MVSGVLAAPADAINQARGASEAAQRKVEEIAPAPPPTDPMSTDPAGAGELAGGLGVHLQSVVLIEGLGAFSRPGAQACATLARHIGARRSMLRKAVSNGGAGPRNYPDLDAAVAARLRTVAASPGEQSLTEGAARAMVARGTRAAQGGGVVFRHDPGILPTQPAYADEDGVRSFLSAMAGVPTLLVSAEYGWPFPKNVSERATLLRRCQHHHLSGASHHLHLDACSAPRVADLVERFFEELPAPDR
jgi:hypothetical protein